jgi:hypothetical protein
MSGSVTAVTQMWSRNGGSYTSERFDTFANNWTITEAYCVVCTVDTDIKTIRNATGVPKHGDPHATESGTFVESVQPEQVSPILWIVTVGYVGVALDAGDIEVDWTDTATSEPIDRDYDGNAILTANKEQVEGLTVEIADQVVVIRRKFTTINTNAIAAYRQATNSDTFLGWPPGTARLVGFQAKNKFKYNAPLELWDVTARIQFRYPYMGATAAQAWYKRWRHEGMYVNVGGVIQRARDPIGQETSRPVLLKADGTQETDPAAALFNYTKVYGTIAYSGLGLL